MDQTLNLFFSCECQQSRSRWLSRQHLSTSAISQLLLNQFGPNFKGRFLGQFLPDAINMSGWHLSWQQLSWWHLLKSAIYPLLLIQFLPNLMDPIFWGKDFSRPKFCYIQTFLEPNLFYQHFFGAKIFLEPKSFWARIFLPKNLLDPAFSQTPNFFSWDQYFLDQNIFRPKIVGLLIFLTQTFSAPKISLNQKIFWDKNFFDPKFLGSKLFWLKMWMNPNFFSSNFFWLKNFDPKFFGLQFS